MPLTLYCYDGSPPVRAVYLCMEALGLKYERKVLDLLNKQTLTPEFSKINPQHTIPTLDDNGTIVWDSHAINAYLVSTYAKDDVLYPKDTKKRALVDQRLHFDSGILFPLIHEIAYNFFALKIKEVPEAKHKGVVEAYDHLEKFLEGRLYLAGDNYTIADFCCVVSVTTLSEVIRIPIDGHPRVKSWVKRCKLSLPGYSKTQDPGIELSKKMTSVE